MAITDPELSRELIAAVKARKVVDLTVVNAMDTPVAWPGVGIGTYAFPYMSVDPLVYFTGPIAPYWVNTHMVDLRTGTHLSPSRLLRPSAGLRHLAIRRADRGLAQGVRGAIRYAQSH